MRRFRKIWNKIIVPAINYTAEGLAIAFLLIGLPIIAILIFG